MFSFCYNLSELDLSSFNINNVKYMCYMFSSCKKLLKLNLSSFITNNVNNMSYMFSSCKNLSEIYLHLIFIMLLTCVICFLF